MSAMTFPDKVVLKSGRVFECIKEHSDTGYSVRFQAKDGNAISPQECTENLMAICHHFNMAGQKIALQITHHITPIPMTRSEQARHRSELNKAVMATRPIPLWVRLVMKLTAWMSVIGILADALMGNTPWYKAVAYMATILIIVPCLAMDMMGWNNGK